MKLRYLPFCLLLCSAARAEAYLTEEKLAPLYDFAGSYGADQSIRRLLQDALSGSVSFQEIMETWLRSGLGECLNGVFTSAMGMLAPLMLLALLRALQPGRNSQGNGAVFLLHIRLISVFFSLACLAIEQVSGCLSAADKFCSLVSPLLTSLLAALGLQGTAALVSPAASMTGSICGRLFREIGLPMCKIALCTASAGSLSELIRLDRFTDLLRKTVAWGAGVITTLFTAFLALQGSVSESVDGIGIRTAKFAVDSASPMIGSGVSDAWESYVSGVMVAKNAVGVSGIGALLLAGAQPIAVGLCVMLVLNLSSALLELFGEREAARTAEQISGVCRMAVSLCTSALAIGMILLGACMAAGRSLLGS